MRICQFGDTHIRNYKYHQDYEIIFEKFYEKLRELKPDLIVNTGDTAHSKNDLSPEWFEVTNKFFKNLADIAPLLVILGNHDGLVNNPSRQNAIRPVVDAIRHPNITLLEGSGIYKFKNINFYNLSCFDKKNKWKMELLNEGINVALFHGLVERSETDLGFSFGVDDIKLEEIEKYDYGFLGDVHKMQFLRGKYAYAGSLIQQNFSEDEEKGFIFWEIEDKNIFKATPIYLEHPCPFINITLNENGELPSNLDVKQNARIRIIPVNKLSVEKLRKIMDIVQLNYNPVDISYSNKYLFDSSQTLDCKVSDVTNLMTQEELIEEHLNEFQLDKETLNNILQLNKKYHNMIVSEDDINRNIFWKIKEFKWSSLFNYGTKNYINFQTLKGIVGFFGDNFCGKSGAVDSLLWTLFGKISKGPAKNAYILNQNKDAGYGKLTLLINNCEYIVKRKLIRSSKDDASTELEFYKIEGGQKIDLSKGKSTDTDKVIRNYFGEIDDFLATSLISQLDSLVFIKLGSVQRKEMLIRFMGLDQFDKKYKLANDDAKELKAQLKSIGEINFEQEIGQLLNSIGNIENEIENNKKLKIELELQKGSIEQQIKSIQLGLNSKNYNRIVDLKEKIKLEESNYKLSLNNLERSNTILKTFEENKIKLSDVSLKYFKIEKDYENYKSFLSFKELINDEIKKYQNVIKMFDTNEIIPCGNEFEEICFFKKNYVANKNKVQEAKNLIKECEERIKIEEEKLGIINDDIKNQYFSLKKVYDYLFDSVAKFDETKMFNEIEFITNKKDYIEKNIKLLKDELSLLENNSQDSQFDEQLLNMLEENKSSIIDNISQINIESLILSQGKMKAKLDILEKNQKDYNNILKQYNIYNLYLKTIHSHGLPYQIIKKVIPTINNEINKILNQVVNFEIYFDADDKKLQLFIKHPKYEPRPLELGSGAEKMLASFAIRLALINISSLPKNNVFILDEPAVSLDQKNISSFIDFVTFLKKKFDTIILISHMEKIKDMSDINIDIKKVNSFASINMEE